MSDGNTGHYYIGSDGCQKATCPRKQEFPSTDDPYCIIHSLESWAKQNAGGGQ